MLAYVSTAVSYTRKIVNYELKTFSIMDPDAEIIKDLETFEKNLVRSAKIKVLKQVKQGPML
jgi:hypothetical protein